MNRPLAALVTPAQAAAMGPDGATIAVGGPQSGRRPLALLRALRHAGVRTGTLLALAPLPEAVPLIGVDALVVEPAELARRRPTAFLVHADAADEDGNVLLDDAPDAWLADRDTAATADIVIASVEQLVSPATVRRRRRELLIGHERVRALVHAPFGAHPLSFPGRYPADPGADVLGPVVEDHWAYLDAVGFARLVRRATLSEGEPNT
jgi:acyl CoA:acetate/3-ketoacid CoA transferase alpha subunit